MFSASGSVVWVSSLILRTSSLSKVFFVITVLSIAFWYVSAGVTYILPKSLYKNAYPPYKDARSGHSSSKMSFPAKNAFY